MTLLRNAQQAGPLHHLLGRDLLERSFGDQTWLLHTHHYTTNKGYTNVLSVSAHAPSPHTPLQQHRFTYNEPMPVESTTQSLCDLALRFGEDSDEGGGMVRSCMQGLVDCLRTWLLLQGLCGGGLVSEGQAAADSRMQYCCLHTFCGH